jgi:uncharacterized protein
MEKDKTLTTALTRVTVLDALRGFALLGVIIMHMLQHYSISTGPETEELKPLFPVADEIIGWVGRNIISGKFINIFAFLFGLSFFIQMDRAAQKGIDFRKRFVWRMIILLIIGQIGNMFYSGEIISIYAVYGVLLVLVYSVRSWILLFVFSLLLLGTPRMLQIGYDQLQKSEPAAKEVRSVGNKIRQGSRMTRETEEPSFVNSVKHNFTNGLNRKLNYQYGLFGRGYLTFALFILGLVVGRTGYFQNVIMQKRKNFLFFTGFVLTYAIITTLVNLYPLNLFGLLRSGEPLPLSSLLILSLTDIGSVAFSGAMVTGFMLLYETKGFGKSLEVLSPYGRMGLTNYEVQSVIGCFLFSTWAFGSYFGRLGATELFVTGLIVYVIQLLFSKFWLRHYRYGPLEWLWRSATYLKFQPLRK